MRREPPRDLGDDGSSGLQIAERAVFLGSGRKRAPQLRPRGEPAKRRRVCFFF